MEDEYDDAEDENEEARAARIRARGIRLDEEMDDDDDDDDDNDVRMGEGGQGGARGAYAYGVDGARSIDEWDLRVATTKATSLAAEMALVETELQDLENFLYSVSHPGCDAAALPHPPRTQTGNDDDDIQIARNPILPLNFICPLTQKGLMEIDQVVEDHVGYVYDRQAMENYLARQRQEPGRPVPCPVQGSRHHVEMRQLKVSKRAMLFKTCAAWGVDLARGQAVAAVDLDA